MHCFYIEAPEGALAALPAEEAKHAVKVLRLRPGDAVCAMDGAGRRFDAAVAAVDGVDVTLRLLHELPSNEAPARVTVYQGVPKADKLELIAQKLTELGVCALIPVNMEYCVAKPDRKDAGKRVERLTRIAREAAKQCRRAMPAEILPPMDWAEARARMAAHDLVLVPWEAQDGRRMRDAFKARPEARDIGIVVGAEGGMSEAEVRALEALGALPVTLGPRILRTETAAIVASALALSLWGDL